MVGSWQDEGRATKFGMGWGLSSGVAISPSLARPPARPVEVTREHRRQLGAGACG